MTVAYFFLFIRKFKEYLFLKGALIYQGKTTSRSYNFLENYDLGVRISPKKYSEVFN